MTKKDKEKDTLKNMKDELIDWEMEIPEFKEAKAEVEELYSDLLPCFTRGCISTSLSIDKLVRMTWGAWNPHYRKYDHIMDDTTRRNRELTRSRSTDPDENNRLAWVYLCIMSHTQGIKDEAMEELTQKLIG